MLSATAFPLRWHFPSASVPKQCGCVSRHVCERPKEQRWSEKTSGKTPMFSATPTAVRVLDLKLWSKLDHGFPDA